MWLAILKDSYLAISLALVAGAYWPWALYNELALRPFTEGIAVWLIVGLAPVAMAEWLGRAARAAWSMAKALVHERFCTYP